LPYMANSLNLALSFSSLWNPLLFRTESFIYILPYHQVKGKISFIICPD
jgi:hypothetical protein